MLNFLLAISSIGLACFLWGLIEAKLYRVRHHTLAVLPSGSKSIEILQISDLHLRRANKTLIRFLQSLSSKNFDVVLATGDLLGEPEITRECAGLLNGLHARRARYFVLGSSDYYAPRIKNYLEYFIKKRTQGARRNPTSEFTGPLVEAGWIDLTNTNLSQDWNGISVQITGLDDPYLDRDDRSLLRRDPRVAFAVCITHDPAPYEDAARAGFDLVISGHTHGGQVRFPIIGAVVTNSDLPTNRARWTSTIGETLLFVSPGLGTGRYAPFRFLCRPEASLLTLVAKARTSARDE